MHRIANRTWTGALLAVVASAASSAGATVEDATKAMATTMVAAAAGGAASTAGGPPPSMASCELLDDFNRSDGTDMGANWVEQVLDFSIDSNQARASADFSFTLMTFVGGSGDTLCVDTFADGPKVQYTALVLRYADQANNVFVKVQDNDSSGTYDRAFFYYGNQGSSWNATYFFDLVEFTSARILAHVSGTDVTLQIDTDFDDVADQEYTVGDLPTENLGTGIGLGGYNAALMDDFRAVGVSTCGDGTVDPGEACDDGNTMDGDCCSSTCQMPGGCDSGVGKGLFVAKEKVAGKEKLVAKLLKGPALGQSDFGDPLAGGGTAYRLCVWDDGGELVGTYEVDRAGDLCSGGSSDCWKPVGKAPPDGKGFKFKDKDAASDGVQKLILKGGDLGKSKALIKGKGSQLPGVAAALQGSTSVTLQLHGSDAAVCLETTLSDVKKADADFFKAK